MEQCAHLPFCQVRISKLLIFIPFLSKIHWYSVASTNEAAFVIGGAISRNIIAQFKDNEWSLYGNLQRPRNNHASITSGDMTIVIGGWTNDGR